MIDTKTPISSVSFNGAKNTPPLAVQEKTVNPTTEQQEILPDENYKLSKVTVNAVTSSIDSNIQPYNIKKGVTILGVEGNVAPDKPDQFKIVEPTTSEQVVQADIGYELASVTVKGVTSDIDSNIKPENIKDGVIILGVEGELESGGGGDSGGKYLVQVIDYDGTVLKSDHLDTGATFELPEAPTNHSRLVFQEWSSPVTITDNTITVGNSDITIGATYKTASGLTEIDIVLTKVTGLEVTCKMVGNKNWGDGTTNSETTHTYTEYGSYTITCDGTEPPQYVFGQVSSTNNCFCKNVYIGELVTSIGNNAFTNCYSLTSVTIPSGVTSIDYGAFGVCYSLTSVTIPSGVTSIGGNAFRYCYSLTKYNFTSATSIPTLSNINAFNGINGICKIYVPDALYDDWIVATNWATYADYIYKASEMED